MSCAATTIIAGTAAAAGVVGVAGSLGAFGKPGSQSSNPMVLPDNTSAAGDQQAETDAANQAALQEKQDATTRNGARASLLTPASDASTFGSNPVAKKSLLGG